MKKRLFIALTVVCSMAASSFASITINLDAGSLKADATHNLPVGSLLLMVAAGGDATFSTLESGSFTAGNDILLAAAAFNLGGFGPQETTNAINFTTSAVVGDHVALLFFPTITLAQYTAAGGSGSLITAGAKYGLIDPNGTNPDPEIDGGDTWTVPGDGAVSLNFITSDNGGASGNTPSMGYASYTVIPEPSSFAIVGVGLAALLGLRKRRS